MCISLVLVVELNIELTAMVTIGVLGVTLVTMMMKSVFNFNEARKQINTKRVIILIVSVIVATAFISF